jgi:superoxide reductase
MKPLAELFQTADWKTEKHMPVIECPSEVKAGEAFQLVASVGKEIAHPNTTDHHIVWIAIYYQPDGDKFPLEIGRTDFTAHGQSPLGPNMGSAYTQPQIRLTLKLGKSGALYAVSMCNIHGLWQSAAAIAVS